VPFVKNLPAQASGARELARGAARDSEERQEKMIICMHGIL